MTKFKARAYRNSVGILENEAHGGARNLRQNTLKQNWNIYDGQKAPKANTKCITTKSESLTNKMLF